MPLVAGYAFINGGLHLPRHPARRINFQQARGLVWADTHPVIFFETIQNSKTNLHNEGWFF